MNSVLEPEMMDLDEDEGKANPLENSLVIRKIFSSLSTKELKGVSLVNKFWNHEARCELREQRKCVAAINGDRPCSRAKELNDILGSGSLNALPFSRLNVSILRNHDCVDEVTPAKVEEIYGNLLKMPLKYLKFWWWRHSEDCVLGQLLLKLMAKSLTLEQLEITDISRKVGLEQGRDEQEEQCQLPKLKTLHFCEAIRGAEDELFWGNFLRTISDRAPNLQVLKNTVKLHWIEYVPTEKLRIFKNIELPNFWPRDADVLTLMNRFSNEEPKIYKLEANWPQISTRGFKMEDYRTLLFKILNSSSGSLQEVILDSLSVLMLKDGLR